MVDYAESVVKENSNVYVNKNISISTVWIPISKLSFTLIVAAFIYILGYQNNTIAQSQHNINMKKSKLIELTLTMDSLQAQKAKVFSSNTIIADSKSNKMKIAKNIQIVY